MTSENIDIERFMAVKSKIGEILSNFVQVPEVLENLIHEVFIVKYWIPALTSVSFDPHVGRNYEVLENIGDVRLGADFSVYLNKLLPEGTEFIYSEMSSYYTSNEYIASRSEALGLVDVFQVVDPREKTDGAKADIYEAFVGALLMSGNELLDGLGSSLTYNFVVWDFRGLSLDLEKGVGAARTNVEQIFTRFNISAPILESRATRGGTNSIVFLEKQHLQLLAGKNIKVPNVDRLEIGSSFGKTKAKANQGAFVEARDFLKKNYDIDAEWAESLKNEMEMKQIKPQSLVIEARQRAAKDGYEYIYFHVLGKSSTVDGFMLVLIGVTKVGTRGTLIARYFETHDEAIKVTHAAAYLSIIKEYTSM
jgi:dsRNA-specific ribonuclease